MGKQFKNFLTEDECRSRIDLPSELIGKTTQDVRPKDARKFFPKRRTWADGWMYVLLSLIPFAPEFLLQRVYDKIVGYLYYASRTQSKRLEKDLAALDHEVWPTLRKAMKHNLGMALLMLNYGYRSRFLPRAVTVGAQAVLLELFHSGRTRSISGDFEYIPYEDAMIEMIIWESISICMSERTEFVQEQIKEVCTKANGVVESLSCGAGLLPQLRTNDFPQDLNLHVTAVDMDERNLENLSLVYPKPIHEYYGTDYRLMDMIDYCNSPMNVNSKDIVDAMGVLSYYRWGNRTETMIRMLLRPVKPGGILVCDLQLMNGMLIRCAESMGWKSNLFPDWNKWTAKRRMKRICRRLGVKMEYSYSRYLKHAAGINFVIYKPEVTTHRIAKIT